MPDSPPDFAEWVLEMERELLGLREQERNTEHNENLRTYLAKEGDKVSRRLEWLRANSPRDPRGDNPKE